MKTRYAEQQIKWVSKKEMPASGVTELRRRQGFAEVSCLPVSATCHSRAEAQSSAAIRRHRIALNTRTYQMEV